MFKGDFMQLILLLLLLMSGPSAIKDVKPLIEGVVGDDLSGLFGQAEGLGDIVSALASASSPAATAASCANDVPSGHEAHDFFPLAPVAGIADEGITYSLSRYISTGQ